MTDEEIDQFVDAWLNGDVEIAMTPASHNNKHNERDTQMETRLIEIKDFPQESAPQSTEVRQLFDPPESYEDYLLTHSESEVTA